MRGLESDPFAHEEEPWPGPPPGPGCELRKARFWMHRIRGPARAGRLVYLVNIQKREVVLVWLYTHAEFQQRPADVDLQQALNRLFSADEEK